MFEPWIHDAPSSNGKFEPLNKFKEVVFILPPMYELHYNTATFWPAFDSYTAVEMPAMPPPIMIVSNFRPFFIEEVGLFV